jgi:hypothetical protein
LTDLPGVPDAAFVAVNRHLTIDAVTQLAEKIAVTKGFEMEIIDWPSSLSEAHKIASSSFQKVSRYLEIELSLHRKERSAPKIILKVLKNEIARLMETSPIIQPVIIDEYNKKYSNEKAKKPAIVNGLKSVIINDDVILTISGSSPKEKFSKNILESELELVEVFNDDISNLNKPE